LLRLGEARLPADGGSRLTLVDRSGKARPRTDRPAAMTPSPPFADLPARLARAGLLGVARRRPRVFVAGAILLVVYFALAGAGLREATRALAAWNAGSWSFVALVGWMMASARPGSVRDHAAVEDENAWVLLLVASVAAGCAMAAIVWELGPVKEMKGFEKVVHVALVVATILSAWTFIHLMFAMHYAGEYYAKGADGEARGGLTFPGTNEPGWSDFLYQAFVIGCACATADVNVTSSTMRGVCVAQGVVAFFFNTIILALTINIGAGFF
jgi:uncharacterized membrane protein